MTQAFYNIYGRYPRPALPISRYYVKFSPSTLSQLATLEDEDIDLTAFPLDRKVIFEGDYYLQPGKAIEDLPDLWAVVPVNYIFPAGIPYIIITNMYIPDDSPVLEDEALYLTGNLGDDPSDYNMTNGDKSYLETRARRISYINSVECDCVCPDPTLECVLPAHCFEPDPCGVGGGGGGGGGGSTSCSIYPRGKILVQNKLATDFSYRGVRNVRVVIRRTFKVDRLFTADDGSFVTTKYFRNKYTILTKFKNQYARIGRMRPWAIWEQYFPTKINFGRWKNLPCNYEFKINNPTATRTIQASHWAAATTHNGVQEHREMSIEENVGLPPTGMHILLAKNKSGNAGNTYMYNKIRKSGGVIPSDVIQAAAISFIPVAGPTIAAILEIWEIRSPDVVFGYGGNLISFYATDQYCEVLYHELSHATHYNKVGNWWWTEFGVSEYLNTFNGLGVYGPCCTAHSPRIAVGEAWAYHMGHYLSDKKWGLQSTTLPEQGTDIKEHENVLFFSNGGGYSSHTNFLEKFNPNRNYSLDPNAWIPKGLLNDLMDGGIEDPQSTIDIYDNVSGYSNAQFYNALTSDVGGMFSYKGKLLQQNNNNQANAVNILFQRYGY